MKDRKSKIEMVLAQAEKACGTSESDLAWRRLCREMEHLVHPESKSPRFDALLRAVWVAATNEQS